MADTVFKVYVIRGLDHKSQTIDPPIIRVFDTSNPRFAHGSQVINEPESRATKYNQVSSWVDTKIGLFCGKSGCVDCPTTHKIAPITPDYEIFRLVYTDWVARGSTGGVVVVKSSTVSVVGSTEVASILSDALTEVPDLDVFFYSKWLDRADQFNVVKTYDGATGCFKTVRTWNANGLQAYALTAAGLGKLAAAYPPDSNPVVCRPFSQVVNGLIKNGHLHAITTTPSLMQFDSSLVTTNEDFTAPNSNSYLKTCEVRSINFPERPLNRRISADLSFFWIIIITLVVIISAWIFLKLGYMYSEASHVARKVGKK